MADALRPASLLLGAACLWAACLLLLALAGLGTRVADSGLQPVAPEIPRVTLAATPSRLGPLLDYAQVGQRPLLNADRRPAAPVAEAGGTDELDVVLTSVLITPRLQLAILTDNKDQRSRRVRVGESVEGTNWRLASLEPRRAVLDGPAGRRTLELRVYDGQGGIAPTAVAAEGEGPATPGTLGANGASAPTPPPAPRNTRNRNAPPTAQAGGAVRPMPLPAPTAEPPPATQDAQIEAIRRRIEARRAQMRAEAESAGSPTR